MIVPELRQLRYIIAVAEQGSVTQAAERLHIAQQALSQQVKVVEEQLGVKLFERGNRGVAITPAGEVFVAEARRVVKGSERVVQRTQAAARGEAGALRIGYTTSSAYETVPAIIGALKTSTPDLRVEQREMTAAEMEPALLEGRVDVAICPRMTVGAELGRLELRREPFAVAVADTHPLAARAELPVSELAEEEFALWPREVAPGYHDAVIAACRAAGFEPKLGAPASGSTVWGDIAGGRGVGLVVRSLAALVPRGISLIPVPDPAPTLVFDLLWSHEHESPAVSRAREVSTRAALSAGWISAAAGRWPRADSGW